MQSRSIGSRCDKKGYICYSIQTEERHYETAADSTTINVILTVGNKRTTLVNQVFTSHYFRYPSETVTGFTECNPNDVISIAVNGTSLQSYSIFQVEIS